MPIRFVLMVNKQGQTRLAQYYETMTIREKNTLESEMIRKCLARGEDQCSFIEFRQYKCVYRRYASLFFIVGVDPIDVRSDHIDRSINIICNNHSTYSHLHHTPMR